MCGRRLEAEECPLREPDCGNQRFMRNQPRVRVQATATRGAGLFTTHRHAQHALVVEFKGEVLTRPAMDVRAQLIGERAWDYTMTLDADAGSAAKHLVLDATHFASPARFANHSCDGGTCRLERWKVDGKWRMGLFASAPMEAGAEVTFDYMGGRPQGQLFFQCQCGSSSCRGDPKIRHGLLLLHIAT